MTAASARPGRHRPVLAWVAAVALGLLALLIAYPAVGITLSLVEFGVPLADVPRTDAFWSLGMVLVPYALAFAVAAFGVWKGWRIAHAAAVLMSAWLVFSYVTSPQTYRDGLAWGLVALAAIALVALLASWRFFWIRRNPSVEADTAPSA